VNLVKQVISGWKQDNLLRKIVRNSGYLFVGNTLSTIVQSILSARLLGILGFGILGVVVEFATNINRLLSFRMGELVVKYMGQYLVEDRKDRAAAIFKASILLETLSSILAYLLLLLLAPLAAAVIVKDTNAGELISFYALALLANFATESSTGFLQVTDRFRSQAFIGFLQSLLTAALVICVYLIHGSIQQVLGAYLVGKVFNGLALAGFAFWRARHTLGPGWWRVSLKLLPPAREFWGFAWSTNVSGTITMITRDSESVWLSLLLGPFSAGVYKTAKAVINLVTLPITPFITAAYPAINRAVAEKTWPRLRDLLKKLTWISALWTGGVSTGLLLVGQWLITTFYGVEYAPAYPVVLILLIGFGIANIFYWNRNLLLSLGLPSYPMWVIAIVGSVKLLLTFLLVPHFGYLMEAALLAAFFVVSIGLIVLRGLRLIKGGEQEKQEINSLVPPVDIPSSVIDSPFEKDPKPGSYTKTGAIKRNFQIRKWFINVNRWDWLACLVFLAFSFIYFFGHLQGNYPLVILTGDAGNLASYAAALDHPEWFSKDAILGQPENIAVYATIHVPLIRLFNKVVDNYGLASSLLVLLQTFLQLLGFYILGRVLFKKRLWGFLLAFLTAMTVIDIGLGEIWGVWPDSLPRILFQSLLPFILVASLAWKDHPWRWILLMIFAGLLVYVHPISAPAWGFALWISIWLFHPKEWTWGKRLLVMLGLGLVFLLVLSPFVINYLSYRGGDPVGDVTTITSILKTYSPENLFNVPGAMGEFLVSMSKNLLIPLGLLGIIVTWIVKKTDRLYLKVILVWMLGIFITSILVPWGERIIEDRLRILPIETELLRCIRYFVPLLLIFWLWPLVEVSSRVKKAIYRTFVFVVGITLVGFWGVTHRPAVGDMLDAISCFAKGRLVCSSTRPMDELLLALGSETQPGDGIFFYNQDLSATSQSLSVRYQAYRSLVYSYRDSGILGYGNRDALLSWYGITRRVDEIRLELDAGEKLARIILLAEELSSDFLIIDFAITPEQLKDLPITVVMQNEEYTLIRLH
jgi:O-antigen/teichoic acid export membrane protein